MRLDDRVSVLDTLHRKRQGLRGLSTLTGHVATSLAKCSNVALVMIVCIEGSEIEFAPSCKGGLVLIVKCDHSIG